MRVAACCWRVFFRPVPPSGADLLTAEDEPDDSAAKFSSLELEADSKGPGSATGVATFMSCGAVNR